MADGSRRISDLDNRLHQTGGQGPSTRWDRHMRRRWEEGAHEATNNSSSDEHSDFNDNQDIVDAEIVYGDQESRRPEKDSPVAPFEPYFPSSDIREATSERVRRQDIRRVRCIERINGGKEENYIGELKDAKKYLKDRISFWNNLANEDKEIYALAAGMTTEDLEKHFNTKLQNAVGQS